MNEESNIPSLTLDPAPAETAAAVAQAPQEEVKVEEEKTKEYDLSSLSPAEQAAVRNFSEKIDVMNTEQVMHYGSSAQKNISDFSDAALGTVRTKDLGEVGNMLGDLVVELKGLNFDAEQKKGLKGLFRKPAQSVAELKASYNKAEANVDSIVEALEKHEITLMKDISLMDKMYDKNQEYLKELTMYILAGKLRIEQLRNEELPKYKARAQETGLPEDAQAANDLEQACVRFEKKLYDLELTRQVALQMLPQIRLVQNNDTLMTEKIQSTLVNTIPLWKNQIVLSLGIQHSKEALEAEREVTNMTNDLLKKNAETLHQATVETARESERGIVDIETLQHTNEQLISTLDEVLAIQKEGHEKREAAELELRRIENQLTDKLLEINNERDITKRK